jgi:hypothetical protein
VRECGTITALFVEAKSISADGITVFPALGIILEKISCFETETGAVDGSVCFVVRESAFLW